MVILRNTQKRMNLKSYLFISILCLVPGYCFQTYNYLGFSILKKKININNGPSRRILSPLFMTEHHPIIECLCSDPEKGIHVVRTISSLLPKLDSIAPQILHANDQVIDFTLNCDWITDDLQKKIVLNSIKFSQFGDNMGSHFLQMYYDLVDKCL